MKFDFSMYFSTHTNWLFVSLLLLAGFAKGVEKNFAPKIKDAISHGSIFLKNDQNKDGSWGSPHQTKGLNIFAPVPGSHRAFRLAVSALSLYALLENQENNATYNKTISKGE